MIAFMTKDSEICCTPPAEKAGENSQNVDAPNGVRQVPDHAVPIPGGRAFVGTNRRELADDGEGPVRRVRIAPFMISTKVLLLLAAFAGGVGRGSGYLPMCTRFDHDQGPVFRSNV